MKIVFMGTPDFAVPCLRRLLDSGHDVAAVYSQPDKPRGRGYRAQPTPVKVLAQERGIPARQPVQLRDGAVARELRADEPDLAVVVAYGRILPPEILAVPRFGCINVHASLLPKLRGAAPIQWSVINGDSVTGITVQYLAEGIDTGDVILQKETAIGPRETSGELFDRLSLLGADCLAEAVSQIEAGTARRLSQDESLATYAPMIDKEMAFVDFTSPPEAVCGLVKGLNPSPVAKTYSQGKLLRILEAAPAPGYHGEPGELLDKKRFIVGCGDGAVTLVTVQPEGKKPMDGGAFIAGRRAEPGAFRLGEKS